MTTPLVSVFLNEKCSECSQCSQRTLNVNDGGFVGTKWGPKPRFYFECNMVMILKLIIGSLPVLGTKSPQLYSSILNLVLNLVQYITSSYT